MFLFTLYCVISCTSPKDEETGESSSSEAIINQQNVKEHKCLNKVGRRLGNSSHKLHIPTPSQMHALKSCEHGINKSDDEGYNSDMPSPANFDAGSRSTPSEPSPILPNVDNTCRSGTQKKSLDYFSFRRNGIADNDNRTFYSDSSEADYKMTPAKRGKRSMHDMSSNIDKPLIVLTNEESMQKKKFDQGNGKTKSEKPKIDKRIEAGLDNDFMNRESINQDVTGTSNLTNTDSIISNLSSIKMRIAELKRPFESYLSTDSYKNTVKAQKTPEMPEHPQYSSSNGEFIPIPEPISLFDKNVLLVEILSYTETMLDYMKAFVTQIHSLEEINNAPFEKVENSKKAGNVTTIACSKYVTITRKVVEDSKKVISEFENGVENVCDMFIISYLKLSGALLQIRKKEIKFENDQVKQLQHENDPLNGTLGINENGEQWIIVKKTQLRRGVQRKPLELECKGIEESKTIQQQSEILNHTDGPNPIQKRTEDLNVMKSELYLIFKEINQTIGNFRQYFMKFSLPALDAIDISTLLQENDSISDNNDDINKTQTPRQEYGDYGQKNFGEIINSNIKSVPQQILNNPSTDCYKILKSQWETQKVLVETIADMTEKFNKDIEEVNINMQEFAEKLEYMD